MNIRNLMLIAILAVVMLTTGCNGFKSGQAVQKPLTTEQLALLEEYRALDKKFEALPASAIAALKAKDLVGYTAASASKRTEAGEVLSLLILNGAELTTPAKADLVVSMSEFTGGGPNKLAITVKNGSPFVYQFGLFHMDPMSWAIDKITTLGTERKVKVLAEAKKTTTR